LIGGVQLSSLNSIESDGFTVSLPDSPATSFEPWFALRVKSNFEWVTSANLRQRGYREFLPTYTIRSRWSDRSKFLERPLFPGYVFCSFNPDRRIPVLTAPGVLYVVGFGKQLVPIDEPEIKALWATLQSGVPLQPWPYLKGGERVLVERGPLKGLEGLVSEFKGRHRLIVSITMLQRSIAAEIDRDVVRPIFSGRSVGRPI
jgi:transcription antitermination factor NusG